MRNDTLTALFVVALRSVRAVNRRVRNHTGLTTERMDEADRRAAELEALITGKEERP